MHCLKHIKQKLTFGTKALCFTMILDAFLLKSCSGGSRRLWRSGSALGGSGGALGGPGRALGGSIYRKTPDQPPLQSELCQCKPILLFGIFCKPIFVVVGYFFVFYVG